MQVKLLSCESGWCTEHVFCGRRNRFRWRRAWAEQVLASGGPPDLLINNAAIITNKGTLWEVPAEEFERLIDININGVVRVIRDFVPAMVKLSKGVIVNFSSGWGRSTSPEVAPYCASKYAIEGLSKALAQELPRGMAAIPLNPGIIDTDMLRSSSAAGRAVIPRRRSGPRKPCRLSWR